MPIALPYPAQLEFHGDRHITRWRPLVQWFLAIPHYVGALALAVAAAGAVLVGFVAVIFTGRFPLGPRDFIVDTWRYGLRVQAYVGFLTDDYPPFSLCPTQVVT